MKLLDTIRLSHGEKTEKGYKYECLICGYKGEMYEYMFVGGSGCQACCNRIIFKGINDIATTNPEYLKYFININDAYKYSISSGKKLNFKCPYCGYNKIMIINTLTKNGLACNKCGDGISYPEKFILNLLDQLYIGFKAHKNFNWSERKEYDFYIEDLSCIIETNGIHHYIQTKRKTKRTLAEECENDILKEKLALNNNIKTYINLDCRESTLEYIKNTVLTSKLVNLFDLSNIDWTQCDISASSSKMIEVCKLWREGLKNTKQISKIIRLSQGTVISYLHRGTKLNMCEYINCKKRRKVMVLDLDGQDLKAFESINELERKSKEIFKIQMDSTSISNVCNGKVKTHKGYKFKFI